VTSESLWEKAEADYAEALKNRYMRGFLDSHLAFLMAEREAAHKQAEALLARMRDLDNQIAHWDSERAKLG
jgi:hypothetical protein